MTAWTLPHCTGPHRTAQCYTAPTPHCNMIYRTNTAPNRIELCSTAVLRGTCPIPDHTYHAYRTVPYRNAPRASHSATLYHTNIVSHPTALLYTRYTIPHCTRPHGCTYRTVQDRTAVHTALYQTALLHDISLVDLPEPRKSSGGPPRKGTPGGRSDPFFFAPKSEGKKTKQKNEPRTAKQHRVFEKVKRAANVTAGDNNIPRSTRFYRSEEALFWAWG